MKNINELLSDIEVSKVNGGSRNKEAEKARIEEKMKEIYEALENDQLDAETRKKFQDLLDRLREYEKIIQG